MIQEDNITITNDGKIIIHDFKEDFEIQYNKNDLSKLEQSKKLNEYVDNYLGKEDEFDEDNFCGFRGGMIYYFPKGSFYGINEDLDNKEYIDVKDLQTYIDVNNLIGEKYVKTRPIHAQKGNNEYIDTYDSEEHYETSSFASTSDWVVYNYLFPENKWVISDEVFKRKYKKLNKDIYVPIFTVEAYRLPENICYIKHNQKYRFLKDGYLIKDLETGEIYGCSLKDFERTYIEVEKYQF